MVRANIALLESAETSTAHIRTSAAFSQGHGSEFPEDTEAGSLEMSEYGGYLFIFDEERRAAMLSDRGTHQFSEAISAPDWKPKGVEVCLLSFGDGHIDGAALARRGRMVVTNKYRVSFGPIFRFPPVGIQEITRAIGTTFQSHFIRSTVGAGKRVSPKTWAQLIRAIKHLRPEAAEALDDLETRRVNEARAYLKEGFQTMAQEKDAVGLALDIFGEDRAQVLSHWDSSADGQPAPFLQGLEKTYLREDPMIINDMGVFGDWSEIKRYQVGGAMFEKGEERLTIINANRTPIEQSLGVDLVYYQHRYHSFVMVQYKRMLQEGSKWVYRPQHDRNYEIELRRMQDFESACPDIPRDWTIDEYRLHARAFYWKLCESVTFKPTARELIQGMYLPLDYWETLVKSDRARGDMGALAISRANTKRYLNNTLFTHLVQDGWIGSRADTSDILSDVIGQCLENGKSVIIAAAQPRKIA